MCCIPEAFGHAKVWLNGSTVRDSPCHVGVRRAQKRLLHFAIEDDTRVSGLESFVRPGDVCGVLEAGVTSIAPGVTNNPDRANQGTSKQSRGNSQCKSRQLLGTIGQRRFGGGFSAQFFCVAELSLPRQSEIPARRTPCI